MKKRSSKRAILAAAIKVAREKGIRKFTRADIAELTGVSKATISYHFGSVDRLRRCVVEEAIQQEILPILADARTDRNSAELYTRMSAELKQKVAAYVAS